MRETTTVTAVVGGLVGLWAILQASPAAAEPPAQVERTVRGWSDGQQDAAARLVVEKSVRGERLVDGVSEDFYYELTEVRQAAGGALVEAYRSGEGDGALPEEWEEAAASGEAPAVGDGRGVEPERRWSSPDLRWMIATTGSTRKKEVEHPRRGLQYVCVLEEQLVLIDRKDRKVHVVGTWSERGEQASKRGEAYCPESSWRVAWHPESSHWAVVRRTTLTGALVRAPEVVAGAAESPEAERSVAIEAAERPLADEAEKWPEGPPRKGIRALYSGRYEKAKNALEWAISRKDGDTKADAKLRLPLAMAVARLGDARKAVEHVEAGLKHHDDYWAHAQAAAVYQLVGQPEKVTSHLKKARHKKSSYADWVRVGELFQYVDLGVANEVLVEALKGEDASSVDKTYDYAYRLLTGGLLDAGMGEQAGVLFDKLDTLPPRMRALKMRATLRDSPAGERPEGMARRVAELLVEAPGLCAGYGVLGRVLAVDGQRTRALRQLRTAAFCDPDDPTAHFELGTWALRMGELGEARHHLDTYLRLAAERNGDAIRARRRQRAGRLLRRLDYGGVILTSVVCEPSPIGRMQCRGVIENRGSSKADEVVVRALRVTNDASNDGDDESAEPQTLTRQTLPAINAGGSRTFSVAVGSAPAGEIVLEAGRNETEFELNRTPAVSE